MGRHARSHTGYTTDAPRGAQTNLKELTIMANETETTETTETKDKKFNADSVNNLGAAIGNFIPTYKKFGRSCRQAINSCLLFYSGN
jgi:hypothetical protein